jgi:Acetyltransferase (GNAT) domain
LRPSICLVRTPSEESDQALMWTSPLILSAKRVVETYKMAEVQIIDPTTYPKWDNLLFTNPDTTFFHTAAWAQVLSESYRYKPLYFTIIGEGRLSGLIPVMEIDSFLTGKRGVSLPFTDICNPIADSGDIFRQLMEFMTQYGRRVGWKCIELRGGSGFLDDAPAFSEQFTHTISLNGDMALFSKSIRDSTRRNIRKADREGIDITFGHTRQNLETFYGLHCKTRKRHGLPPQPWSFFGKIHERILAAQKGFVALAAYRKQQVAGAIYFHFKDVGIYKYGASEKTFQHLRPNNLLMWRAIERLRDKGLSRLELGRTEQGNEGLRRFKTGWGAKEKKLLYYRYELKKEKFIANTCATRTSYAVFKHLPLPIIRLTGNLLYRHVG